LSSSGTKHKEEKNFKISVKEKQYEDAELTGMV